MQPTLRRHPCFYREAIPLASPETTCTDRRETTKNEEDATRGRRYERDEGGASGAGRSYEASYALLAPVIIVTARLAGSPS